MEGGRKQSQAYDSLAEMRKHCDTVIPISNDMLLQHVDEDATVLDAFDLIDGWISRGIQSVCSIINNTGLINLDMNSLRRVFAIKGGKSLFSLGFGKGKNYAQKAIDDLMACPLLHLPESARNADRLLVNLIGGTGLSLAEVHDIVGKITEKFSSANETIIGAVIDETRSNSLEICVIGTTDINAGGGDANTISSEEIIHAPVAEVVEQEIEEAEQGDPENLQPVLDATWNDENGNTVHKSKLKPKTKAKPDPREQEEFGFADKNEQRGYFDDTEKNIFEGQDLDVPTFLRKGIKISITV